MKTTYLLSAAVVLALSLAVVACGSGSTSTQETPSAQQKPPETTASPGSPKTSGGPKAAGGGSRSEKSSHKQDSRSTSSESRFTPRPHHDSAGGAKQFVQKGGDNSVQEYGSEQSGSDFAEAAAALHTYLDARAAGAWDAACSALARGMVEQLVNQLGKTVKGKETCAEVLAALDSEVPPAALREADQADVAALRAEGDSGFLLYRGARGESFFIPMHREDGRWKVAAVGPSPLP